MKLDEAIKILNNLPIEGQQIPLKDRLDATKLGMEGLKAWQEHRRIVGHPKLWILPSED